MHQGVLQCVVHPIVHFRANPFHSNILLTTKQCFILYEIQWRTYELIRKLNCQLKCIQPFFFQGHKTENIHNYVLLIPSFYIGCSGLFIVISIAKTSPLLKLFGGMVVCRGCVCVLTASLARKKNVKFSWSTLSWSHMP